MENFLKMKNRKNRMYAYHKYLSSTGSEGFKQIHSTTSSTTGAHFPQKYFSIFFGDLILGWQQDGHGLLKMLGFGVLNL